MFLLDRDLFAFYLVTKFDTDEIRSVVMMAGLVIAVAGLAMVFLTPQFAVAQSARDGVAWTGFLLTGQQPEKPWSFCSVRPLNLSATVI